MFITQYFSSSLDRTGTLWQGTGLQSTAPIGSSNTSVPSGFYRVTAVVINLADLAPTEAVPRSRDTAHATRDSASVIDAPGNPIPGVPPSPVIVNRAPGVFVFANDAKLPAPVTCVNRIITTAGPPNDGAAE
ncbi:unnamed protein product, partial [Iphiclides podalirius]